MANLATKTPQTLTTQKSNLNMIRADKNIANIISKLMEKDSYNVVVSLLMYFYHCTQNNLFGFGVLDPQNFGEVMGFTPEFLRMKHPDPIQPRVENWSKDEIKRRYELEKKYPEERIYDSLLENALYILTQTVNLSKGAQLVSFDEGVKYMNQIKSFQFLTDIACVYDRSKSRGKPKIFYQYALNPQILNNLNHFYFDEYIEDFVAVRKAGKNLDGLYLYLKNQENFTTGNLENTFRASLDVLADKLQLSEKYEQKYKKREVKRAIEKILKVTKNFSCSLDWESAGKNARWQYIPVITFNSRFKNNQQLVEYNKEAKEVMLQQAIFYEFLELFKNLNGSIIEADNKTKQKHFKEWFFNSEIDYKEKLHAYDNGILKISGKFPSNHEEIKQSFFSQVFAKNASLPQCFPNIPSSNFFPENISTKLLNTSGPETDKNSSPSFSDERQTRCYKRMTDWGFPSKQARNCAENEKTMSLFFKWKADSGIDSHIKNGRITKEEAKKMFFGELKKNDLKI